MFCRWKRTSAGVMVENGKKVLEFVAILRKDNNQWAIPGVSNVPMQRQYGLYKRRQKKLISFALFICSDKG